jgi:hypothetical protein
MTANNEATAAAAMAATPRTAMTSRARRINLLSVRTIA